MNGAPGIRTPGSSGDVGKAARGLLDRGQSAALQRPAEGGSEPSE